MNDKYELFYSRSIATVAEEVKSKFALTQTFPSNIMNVDETLVVITDEGITIGRTVEHYETVDGNFRQHVSVNGVHIFTRNYGPVASGEYGKFETTATYIIPNPDAKFYM